MISEESSLPGIAHTFRDGGLLAQALTHRSAGGNNNERLEFLGDALINCIVAEALFERYPKADEGELTRLRARFVSGDALAAVARELKLGDRLHLGSGELKSGGFRRDSILADAFEAIVAAIYLDGGFAACRAAVRTLFEARFSDVQIADAVKDAKTALQEALQAQSLPLPIYVVLSAEGEDHAKTFRVGCQVDGMGEGSLGEGSSRRAAEQAAAATMLNRMKERERDGR